ncbi:MAG: exo-alpha-sialidase [Clostridia bacterium]|nr:exo-alpha-sialidase [Clostridia bacterium]
MKKPMTWSYAPYRYPFDSVGDIYICRIVPTDTEISFDFLDIGAAEYSVYYRLRSIGKYTLAGTVKPNVTRDVTYTIGGLTIGNEYEFYVEADGKKSRVRLAKCGHFDCESIINYLHPDDEAYAFSGRYLCSPSIIHHPDGHLLSSMDVFAGNHPQNLTLIYRSDDNGKTWHYACELFPCFWGKMFIHKGELYMFGCSTEYGDMLIGKSTDGGYSFCEPTILYRGSNGKNGNAGMHRNPEPVVEHSGRIWNTVEWGTWSKGYHAVMAVSAPVDADLLDSQSWEFSEPVKYREWEGLPKGKSAGNIEGCLVIGRDGNLYSMMRYDMSKLTPNYGLAMLYKINTKDPAAPMRFVKPIKFEANHSKFEVAWDEE